MSTDLTVASLRRPGADDGVALHGLIQACPPLDVNTVYLYHLICRHHAATSVVAEADGQLVGAITGYLLPQDQDVLFIWQVAVHSAGRGQGLATRMLAELCDGLRSRWLHTTVGPGNTASRTLFERFAQKRELAYAWEPWLSGEQCGDGHEPEDLLRIGPSPS